MKKYLQYLVPFAAMFFLIPLVSSGTVMAQDPVKLNWGIDIGDQVTMTMGWAIELDLTPGTWDLLTDYLEMVEPNITVGAEEIYNDFSQLESVYHFRVTISDMDNYDYGYGYSFDRIYGDLEFKSVSMPNYGALNETLIYEIQQNAALFDKYSTMLGANITAVEAIQDLATYGPGEDDMVYSQMWYIDDELGALRPSGYPLFIHKDWDLTELYDELKSELVPADYADLSSMLGVSITNWNEFTDALGFTKIAVSKREATVKFQLSSMNEIVLDTYVDNMGIEDPVTHIPIDTYDDFLAFMNITDFNVEAHFHVEWTTAGILNNFHAQCEIKGTYEGEKFSIKPQFDISRGEHNNINSKFTIPGFPLYIILVTGVATVSFIIVRIKKKNY